MGFSEIFPHSKLRPGFEFMVEVFAYDVRQLPNTDAKTLSCYIVALSQYLVYLNSELNRIKSDMVKKRRYIDNTINQLLTKELLKEYTAKKDAASFLIASTPELSQANDEMEELQDQLYLLEGSDKSLYELVAAFKRELTRREHERQFAHNQ